MKQKEKPHLDLDRIAKRLGATREGKVAARGGYFGALELLESVRERFRAPAGGGRSTDPRWSERRLVPLTAKTLHRLEHLAEAITAKAGQQVSALQVAALLLEQATFVADEKVVEELAKPKAS